MLKGVAFSFPFLSFPFLSFPFLSTVSGKWHGNLQPTLCSSHAVSPGLGFVQFRPIYLGFRAEDFVQFDAIANYALPATALVISLQW